MFKRALGLLLILFALTSISMGEKKKLIINPQLEGGIGTFPIIGSKIIKTDTISKDTPINQTTHFNFREMYPNGVKPVALLIRGRVPEASKR